MTPEGWQPVKLADITSVIRNGFSCRQDATRSGVPVTRIETIADGVINYERIGYTDASEAALEAYRLQLGDILLSHINSVKHIGKVAMYRGEAPLFHGMNLMLVRFAKQYVWPSYGHYVLASRNAKAYFEGRCKQAVNQASLNRGDIGSFAFLLPPLPEQKKIATILGSVDEAIQATQAVIDQTRKVKQGLLQQLLTRGIGHTRFKKTEIGEIPEEWKVTTLQDAGLWMSGGTPSRANPDYWKGDIPWVSPKDMKRDRLADTIEHITRSAADNGSRLVPEGTVLVVVRGMILAHSFPVAIAGREVSFNQDIKALAPNTAFMPEFIMYWLQSRRSQILELVDESTHGTKRLPQEVLVASVIPCPSRPEQGAIVNRISSIGQFQASEGCKLATLMSLKQGLMQDLLTGRVRVKGVA